MNIRDHIQKEHPYAARNGGTSADTLPPPTITVSVVIVNYNVRDFLKQALISVQNAVGTLDSEIIVVDNNSADGSVEMLQTEFPEVSLIRNEANVGFSKANNQALRVSRGEYILILNPDTIISENTLTVLTRFLEDHPDAGAAGCQILHPDGSFARESRRAFPTPMVAFFRITGLSTLFPRSRLFGRYNMTYLPEDAVAEVDALSGSCMMVKRSALLSDGPLSVSNGSQTGDTEIPRLLDEDFFMYGEDLDWCYRIQQAGWKIYYTPETRIIHYKGESTRKGELRYVKLFYGAMVRFSRKHFRGYGRFVTELLRVAIVFKAALSVLGNAARKAFPVLLDFVIVYLAVTAASLVRTLPDILLPAPLFLAAVAPGYALAATAAIAIFGGYHRHGNSFRPVVAGLLLAALIVAAASFFVKQIAFSRLIVVLSIPVAAIPLGLVRFRRRLKASSISRIVFIGSPADLENFSAVTRTNPNPSFELTGVVPPPDTSPDSFASVEVLGRLDQLRDIVRLRSADTVVVASGCLPNYRIFDLVRQLNDLPVSFRMLTDTYDRVIGKASVNDLSEPRIVAVDKVLRQPRSRLEKRVFEMAVSLLGILSYPVRAVAGIGHLQEINRQTANFFRVIGNSISLVGLRPEDLALGDNDLPLREGAFSIAEALPESSDEDAIRRAYTFYLANETAQLDWDIILKSARSRKGI